MISIDRAIRKGNTIKLVSIADPKRTFTPKVTEMVAPTRTVWSDGMPLGLLTGRRASTITSNANGCEFTRVGPSIRLNGLLDRPER